MRYSEVPGFVRLGHESVKDFAILDFKLDLRFPAYLFHKVGKECEGPTGKEKTASPH